MSNVLESAIAAVRSSHGGDAESAAMRSSHALLEDQR
jgi:hypothetical protein